MTVPEEPQPRIDFGKAGSNAADPTTVFPPGQQPSDSGYSYPTDAPPPAPPAAPPPGAYGYAYPPAGPAYPPSGPAYPPAGHTPPPAPFPPPYGGYPQPPPYGAPYQPYGYQPPTSEAPVFSIIGFVCAVLTLGFMVFCWLGVFVTGPIGIILGVVGHNKGEELGKWAAIASGAAMALGVGLGLLLFGTLLAVS